MRAFWGFAGVVLCVGCYTVCIASDTYSVRLLYSMGWSDILDSDAKMCFFIVSLTDDLVVARQRVVRTVDIPDFFGGTLASIQINTSFFDVEGQLQMSKNILTPDYPLRLESGDTYLKLILGVSTYQLLIHDYEHYETTDFVLSDPDKAYAGFFTVQSRRFLERTIVYRRVGLLTGHYDNPYAQPDFQSQVTHSSGRKYYYSQGKGAYDLLLWRRYYAAPNHRWECAVPGIALHCFDGCPQEPDDIDLLVPHTTSDASEVWYDEFTMPGIEFSYWGENPLSHPLYSHYVNKYTSSGTGWTQKSVLLELPSDWPISDGGGIIINVNRADSDCGGGVIACVGALAVMGGIATDNPLRRLIREREN